MAAVLVVASYFRIGLSLLLAVHARHVRVPGRIAFHLEPVTITEMFIIVIVCYPYYISSQNGKQVK